MNDMSRVPPKPQIVPTLTLTVSALIVAVVPAIAVGALVLAVIWFFDETPAQRGYDVTVALITLFWLLNASAGLSAGVSIFHPIQYVRRAATERKILVRLGVHVSGSLAVGLALARVCGIDSFWARLVVSVGFSLFAAGMAWFAVRTVRTATSAEAAPALKEDRGPGEG